MTRRRAAGARTALAALLAIVAAGGAAPPADARTYTVWSCRGPDWRPAGTSAWAPAAIHAGAGDVQFGDACASGGAMSVALAAGRAFSAPVVGTLTFAVPSGTHIAGYRIWRSLVVAPPWLLGFYDFAAGVAERGRDAGMTLVGCTTQGSGCRSLGDAGNPQSDANVASEQRAPLSAVALQVACRQTRCAKPSGSPATAALYRARIDIEDPHAPERPHLAGELAGSRSVWDRATLVVSGRDRGGGVAAMTLAIDGRPVDTARFPDADGSCREPYDHPQPCADEVAHAFAIDATKLDEGHHVATGTVLDAAGNATTWQQPFTVRRPARSELPDAGGRGQGSGAGGDGGSGPRSNGTPAVRRPVLRLRRRTVEHAPRRAARVLGRLRTARGRPIRGARLTVTVADVGAPRSPRARRRPRTVRTGRRGAFTVRVRRAGAQRVTVAFSPDGRRTTASASATVRTRLAVKVRGSAARLVKGRSLLLRGRLRGAGRSARGALVHVEAIVNGRWAPVGVARAGANGRFRWRYRFVHLERDTIFSFRAVVKRTPGWPWRRQASRRVRVRVDVP